MKKQKILELKEYAKKNNLTLEESIKPVLGIDIDIRAHNKIEIEKHFLYKYIHMIEGSSISKNFCFWLNSLFNPKMDINISHLVITDRCEAAR